MFSPRTIFKNFAKSEDPPVDKAEADKIAADIAKGPPLASNGPPLASNGSTVSSPHAPPSPHGNAEYRPAPLNTHASPMPTPFPKVSVQPFGSPRNNATTQSTSDEDASPSPGKNVSGVEDSNLIAKSTGSPGNKEIIRGFSTSQTPNTKPQKVAANPNASNSDSKEIIRGFSTSQTPLQKGTVNGNRSTASNDVAPAVVATVPQSVEELPRQKLNVKIKDVVTLQPNISNSDRKDVAPSAGRPADSEPRAIASTHKSKGNTIENSKSPIVTKHSPSLLERLLVFINTLLSLGIVCTLCVVCSAIMWKHL